MSKKSHDQQVQFIKDCLFAKNCLDIDASRIDVHALVDGELTLEENWFENIKPKVDALRDNQWESISEEYVINEIEKYEHLAEKTPGVKFERPVV